MKEGEVRTYVLRCKSCGGTMNVSPESNDILICPYCGAKERIEESDAVKIEKLRHDVELNRQKVLERNLKRSRKDQNTRSIRQNLGLMVQIVLLLIYMVFCMAAFGLHWIGSGIVCLIQIGLVTAALVLNLKKNRTKASHLPTILVVLALVLFIPVVLLSGSSDPSGQIIRQTEEIDWDGLNLASQLPKPESTIGRVTDDSSSRLRAEIDPFSLSQFKSYVKACKQAGYTIDALMPYERNFEAYNEEGYHLELYHYDSQNYMILYLDAPIEMSAFIWPSHGLARLVPAPDSQTGKIVSDSSDYFNVYIGNTTQSDFTSYVSRCIEAGFSEDYYQYDRSFSAKNADGIRLSIDYEGFGTMYLRISKP